MTSKMLPGGFGDLASAHKRTFLRHFSVGAFKRISDMAFLQVAACFSFEISGASSMKEGTPALSVKKPGISPSP